MAELEDDNNEDGSSKSKLSKKKALIFLLPVLIVIGMAVGLYHNFGKSGKNSTSTNYTTVTKPGAEGAEAKTTFFYDLPEVHTQIMTDGRIKETAIIKITIELSKAEDIKIIEALLSRFNDIIISHTSELTSEEINGTNGLYWLKEELLYRINLVASPLKIESLDFKAFEVQKAD